MLPVIQVGPVALRTSGLLLLLGLILGLSLAERRLPKGEPGSNHLYNLTFLAILSAVLGGRLFYIARHFELFKASALNMISLDLSLFDPFGAILLAGLGVLVYGQRHKLPFWATVDTFTPALAVLAVFLAAAHFASGTAYGTPTSLPWGIDLWGDRRHPTQLYELLASAGILGLLWKQFGNSTLPGLLSLRFLIMSSAARLLLEAWRGDSTLILAGFRLEQVLAWFFLAAGFLLIEIKSSAGNMQAEKT